MVFYKGFISYKEKNILEIIDTFGKYIPKTNS